MYYPFAVYKQSCFGKMYKIRNNIFVSDNPKIPRAFCRWSFTLRKITLMKKLQMLLQMWYVPLCLATLLILRNCEWGFSLLCSFLRVSLWCFGLGPTQLSLSSKCETKLASRMHSGTCGVHTTLTTILIFRHAILTVCWKLELIVSEKTDFKTVKIRTYQFYFFSVSWSCQDR